MAAQTFRRSKIEKVYEKLKSARDELANFTDINSEIRGRVNALNNVLYVLREEFEIESKESQSFHNE